MSDIFISYAVENRETAAEFAGALEQVGWTVWWDREIPTGRVFADVIKEELDRAMCVVVLWSQQSVTSTWVRREATAAINEQKLFPVLIDAVDPPWEFGELQACDFVNWDGHPSSVPFERLVNDLQRILDLPAKEDKLDDAPPGDPVRKSDVNVGAVQSNVATNSMSQFDNKSPQRHGSGRNPSRFGAGIGTLIGAIQAIFVFALSEQFVSYLFGVLIFACWTLAGALSGAEMSRLLSSLAGFVVGGVIWNSIWAWVGTGKLLQEWTMNSWFLIGGALGVALSQIIVTIWRRSQ